MTRRTQYFSIISTGVIAAALTLALYFMTSWGIEANEIRRISLAFVLLAEAAFFCSMLAIARISSSLSNRTFVWSGFTTALALYWMFTIVMAAFGLFLYENARTFKLHEAIALAITAVVLVIMYAAASHINNEDASAGNAMSYMRDIENRLLFLRGSTELEEYKDRLNAMYEAVKYSDKSKLSEEDKRIESALSALERIIGGDDAEAAEKCLKRLEESVRAREVRQASPRRGGF